METQRFRKTVCAIVIAGTAACNNAPDSKVSAAAPATAAGGIVRISPGRGALVYPTAAVERVSGGFKFLERPLWRPSGVLWFSYLVGNVVHQWSPDGETLYITATTSVYRIHLNVAGEESALQRESSRVVAQMR